MAKRDLVLRLLTDDPSRARTALLLLSGALGYATLVALLRRLPSRRSGAAARAAQKSAFLERHRAAVDELLARDFAGLPALPDQTLRSVQDYHGRVAELVAEECEKISGSFSAGVLVLNCAVGGLCWALAGLPRFDGVRGADSDRAAVLAARSLQTKGWLRCQAPVHAACNEPVVPGEEQRWYTVQPPNHHDAERIRFEEAPDLAELALASVEEKDGPSVVVVKDSSSRVDSAAFRKLLSALGEGLRCPGLVLVALQERDVSMPLSSLGASGRTRAEESTSLLNRASSVAAGRPLFDLVRHSVGPAEGGQHPARASPEDLHRLLGEGRWALRHQACMGAAYPAGARCARFLDADVSVWVRL